MSIFSRFFNRSSTPQAHSASPSAPQKRHSLHEGEHLQAVYLKKDVTLEKKIGEGGEGSVHTIAEHSRIVAKLYSQKNRTMAHEKKLHRLLNKRIDPKEAKAQGIALPIDILIDAKGGFVGYLMPMIEGVPLKNAFFSRRRLETRFPDADRKTLVQFALHFVAQLEYLHSKNILVGDINPLNIMVDLHNPARGWLIDTDSFQVDNLPCPVGTDIFTPPNLQGRNFKSLLRSIDDEHFSAAIMIFMILMIGKHPYSRIGGENPADNIKKRAFPYRSMGSLDQVPAGVWGYIWSHFPRDLKRGFEQVFSEGERLDLKEWNTILKKYAYLLDRGFFCNDIIPLSFRSRNAITVKCRDCNREFQMDARFHEKLTLQKKEPICTLCRQKIKATQLAGRNRNTIHDSIRNARFNARKFRYKDALRKDPHS